jgi:hypothetical protein
MKVALSVLTLLCIGLAIYSIRLATRLEEQAPRLERRDMFCHQVQFTAEQASDNLRSPEPARREWGLGQFKILDLGGWQMANMCSFVSIGATCADHDLPCQLAALDWAMLNIR